MVDGGVRDLLGGHVVRGAHGRTAAGDPGGEADVVCQPGDAEVADLHGPVRGAHHVGRFQVPVHDALGVGVGESRRDLFGHVEDLCQGERLPFVVGQQLAEVAALQQLHDEVEQSVVVPEVVHDRHTPVLERGGDPRLPPEAFPQDAEEPRVLAPPPRLQTLYGHTSAQRLVARPPHFTHAATTHRIEQPVPAMDQGALRHPRLSPPSLPRSSLPCLPSMAASFLRVYANRCRGVRV